MSLVRRYISGKTGSSTVAEVERKKHDSNEAITEESHRRNVWRAGFLSGGCPIGEARL